MTKTKLASKFDNRTKTITKAKTKKHLPLEINLDQIMNPNSQIRAAYNSVPGASDYFYWQDKADWNNERRIFAYAAVTQPGQPKRKISHKIVSLYSKKWNGKDYVFGFEHLSTRDLLGNWVDCTREIGRFSLPHLNATQQYDQQLMNQFSPDQPPSPTITGIEVTSTSEEYEWEFSKILPQLQEWYRNGTISPDCVFTAWVSTKKYTIPSWEMFIGLSLEENVLCNRVGEDSIGLFTETKDVNKAILQLARETGLDRLKKSLSSNERAGRGRKLGNV